MIFLVISTNNVFSNDISITLSGNFDYRNSELTLEFGFLNPDEIKFSKIEIYKRNGGLRNENESISNLSFVKEITREAIENYDSRSKISIYNWNGEFKIDDFVETVVIVATLNNKQIISSPIQINKEIENKSVTITSNPPKYIAYISNEYQYNVKAESSHNTKIEYYLENPQTGLGSGFDESAEIDSQSGILKWTPKSEGNYIFRILAKSIIEGEEYSATQQFSVFVDNCGEATYARIILTDNNGEPLKNAQVILTRDKRSNSFHVSQIKAITDDNGIAKVELISGFYFLHYPLPRMNINYYYGGASIQDDSELIQITCGEINNIDFQIKGIPDTIDNRGLKFIKTPEENKEISILLGEKFEFQFLAEYIHDKSMEIVYYLNTNDNSAKISNDGLLTWTPTKLGRNLIDVRARLKHLPNVLISYILAINVSDCFETTTFDFNIIDENENKLQNGSLILYNADELNNRTPYFNLKIKYSLDLQSDERQIDVEKGSYFIMVRLENTNYWYEASADIHSAKVVSIDCGQTKSLTFKIESQHRRESIRTLVSGYCLDENANGVNAKITFEGKRTNNSGLNEKVVFNTFTNSNGFYSIELPRDFTFIASAINSNTGIPIFWENTRNPFEAKLIHTNSEEIKNINFNFRSDRNNSMIKINGRIISTENEIVKECNIICFKVGKENSVRLSSGISYLTSNGIFDFDLEEDKYIFLVVPRNREYVSGYYKENAIAELAWENATIVEVSKNKNQNIKVILEKISNNQGNSRVNGAIISNSNNHKIENANIILRKQNSTVEYLLSDYNGEFDVLNIADGDYQLIVSKIGYYTYSANIYLDNNIPLNLDINLTPTEELVSSVEIDTKLNSTLLIYPNPTSESIYIQDTEEYNFTDFEVIDINGKIVATGKYNSSKMIDVKNLSNSSYMLKLYGKDKVLFARFTINK
jgi:hypothetical protein